ncbi:ubiquinone biosynthesis accessory factor UbiJ [Aliagarivorans marinus]|uniref:ubiquinone biosynthesis accessory factor UbiJ n=1 Tax=Aliagarivorans marinus TaxID=561965 RepID=UPI000407F90F|nr:SCP2 sterol-binding domain-containing protein [Aliagarivorans marinus]
MPFDNLLTAGLETLSNQLLQLDQASGQRRSELQGQVLRIELRPLKPLFFVVSEQQLDVLGQYEGEVDCGLSLHISSLPELSQSERLPELLKQDKLQVEGDIKLAQQFADLFLKLEPQLEEKLSSVIGDAPAHLAARAFKQLQSTIKSLAEQSPAHVAELARDEWQLLVGNGEYQRWALQVAQLQDRLEALSARVEALAE